MTPNRHLAVHTIFVFFILSAVIWSIVFATRSTEKSVSVEVPLEDIPGILKVVLDAQGSTIQIESPVPYFPQDRMYLFTISILKKTGFGSELNYEFCGDVDSLNHFVDEVGFVNAQHASLLNKSGAFVAGAGEDVWNLVTSLVNMLAHPVDTLAGLWDAGPLVYQYFQDVWNGKREIRTDAVQFASAYVENAYMEVAAKYHLNYQELKTEEAKASVRSLAKPKIAGMATTELATLFVAWVKVTKVATAGEVANAASKAGKAAESAIIAAKTSDLVGAGSSATKSVKWASLFEYGAKAELGAARMVNATVVAERIGAVERLKPLLAPAKVATLKGERALNSRLHKVLYWLYQSEKDGISASETLIRAMRMAKADKRLPGALLDPRIDGAQILRNYNKAKALGVFKDADNLALMRRGKAPWVNSANELEQIWVEHEIPVSKAPELGNCWGNLSYETRSRNLAKSDAITEISILKLEEYKKAGLMKRQQIDRIAGTAVVP